MDKQKIVKALLTELDKDYSKLLKIYEEHKQGCIEAPGPMQSHSDTSRFQLGKLADETAQRLEKLEKLIRFFKQIEIKKNNDIQVGTLVKIEEDGEIIYFYITPEGVGGQKFESEGVLIQTISMDSPFGKALFSKKPKQEIELQVPVGIRKLKILDCY